MRPVTQAVWRWRPDPERRARRIAREAREGRIRGLIQGVVGLLAAFVLYRWFSPVAAGIVAAIALTITVIALASPRGTFARLTHWVGRFAHGVGLVVTWICLPVLFYLVFLPLGLILRARKRLRLTRGPEPERETYWSSAGSWPKAKEGYERQF